MEFLHLRGPAAPTVPWISQIIDGMNTLGFRSKNRVVGDGRPQSILKICRDLFQLGNRPRTTILPTHVNYGCGGLTVSFVGSCYSGSHLETKQARWSGGTRLRPRSNSENRWKRYEPQKSTP